MPVRVCSIDVGIVHLGLVGVTLDTDERGLLRQPLCATFTACELIDLTRLPHARVPRKACTLFHSKGLFDRVAHFIQEYKPELDACDTLLIERQPIMGLVSVEQLILGHYRDKTTLVSPNSMHKFFNIAQFTYEGRKKQTVAIACTLLANHGDTLRKMQRHGRQHDIADAIVLMYFFLHGKHERDVEKWEREQRGTLENPFERFRYTGNLGKKN
jgi:hypothetical protein